MPDVNDIPLEEGCYAESAVGMQHVRKVLVILIEALVPKPRKEVLDVIAQLRKEMSDDDWETDEALDILTNAMPYGWYWSIEEGDLFLIEEGSDLDKQFRGYY